VDALGVVLEIDEEMQNNPVAGLAEEASQAAAEAQRRIDATGLTPSPVIRDAITATAATTTTPTTTSTSSTTTSTTSTTTTSEETTISPGS
jgi:hypothetical protein